MGKRTYVDVGVLAVSNEKDSSGRTAYYLKAGTDKDGNQVEIKINGKKVQYLNFKSMVTSFEERIARADDEEKIEKLEATKSRFEKGGDLEGMKFNCYTSYEN